MSRLSSRLWRMEFVGRIFVSFSIAAAVMGITYAAFPDEPSAVRIVGNLAGLAPETSLRIGYGLLALLVGLCSLVRMWAGSLLTPERVMAFEIQTDLFSTSGPYRFVRNPIYWADLTVETLIALCLPWPGLAMPVLFYLHYVSIVRYEEVTLASRYGQAYQAFMAEVPRLLPTPRSLARLPRALGEFHLSLTGVRHNALWVLLVPGMIVAAVTLEFTHAVLVGLPAVLDWAVIHTIIGVRKRPEGTSVAARFGPTAGRSP